MIKNAHLFFDRKRCRIPAVLYVPLIILIVFSSFIYIQQQHKPTLYLIGDSTVKNGRGDGGGGLWGWGDFIGKHFDPAKITVKNHALGGTSSRTFRTKGLWDSVLNKLKPGDYVLMQFGHNDNGPLDDTARARGTFRSNGEESREIYNPITQKNEVVHSYGWYLRKYITETKAKGATPIVLSPVPRNRWNDGKVNRSSEDYGKWAAEAAKQEGALFVDLNKIIADHYDAIGEEKVKSLYFNAKDNTHTIEAGATRNAACVVEGLRQQKELALNASMLK